MLFDWRSSLLGWRYIWANPSSEPQEYEKQQIAFTSWKFLLKPSTVLHIHKFFCNSTALILCHFANPRKSAYGFLASQMIASQWSSSFLILLMATFSLKSSSFCVRFHLLVFFNYRLLLSSFSCLILRHRKLIGCNLRRPCCIQSYGTKQGWPLPPNPISQS